MEDVRFDNWTMEDVGQGVNVTNYHIMEGEVHSRGQQPVSNRTPVFRNIAISNMTINHSRLPINIEGLPEMPISGLWIPMSLHTAKSASRHLKRRRWSYTTYK